MSKSPTTKTASPLAKSERNERIAKRRKEGETLTSIAKDEGLSVTRVSRIVNNFYERLPKSSKSVDRIARNKATAAA